MTDSKNPAASKVAIVTGAARGIGLATATLFAEQGLFVIMVDRDEVELQLALANLNNNSRHNHIALVCDVSSPDAVRQMIAKALEQAGRIDVLVNNAGVADFGPIEETDFQRWRTVMETNLDAGTYFISALHLGFWTCTGRSNWPNKRYFLHELHYPRTCDDVCY